MPAVVIQQLANSLRPALDAGEDLDTLLATFLAGVRQHFAPE